MSELGTCARCEKPAVCKVNDLAVCIDHVDEAMAEAFAPIRKILDQT